MEDNTNNTKTESPPQCENADPASEEQPKVAGGRNGINNIGNTCYMSTGLQVRQFVVCLLFLVFIPYSRLNKIISFQGVLFYGSNIVFPPFVVE